MLVGQTRRGVQTPMIVLEYLKVILTGPVVAGGITLALAAIFRSEVRSLMGRVAHIKLPGGGELSTSQFENSQAAFAPAAKAPELPPVEGEVKLPALPA